MQAQTSDSSVHQIVERRRYIPTGGGDKESDVFDGYYCTRCGADGTPEAINQKPCKPSRDKEVAR